MSQRLGYSTLPAAVAPLFPKPVWRLSIMPFDLWLTVLDKQRYIIPGSEYPSTTLQVMRDKLQDGETQTQAVEQALAETKGELTEKVRCFSAGLDTSCFLLHALYLTSAPCLLCCVCNLPMAQWKLLSSR